MKVTEKIEREWSVEGLSVSRKTENDVVTYGIYHRDSHAYTFKLTEEDIQNLLVLLKTAIAEE